MAISQSLVSGYDQRLHSQDVNYLELAPLVISGRRFMFKEYVYLNEYTTFRVGGVARYFFVVKTIQDIREAVSFAKGKDIPFFILGGGSNILFGDDGFEGVVIKNEISGLSAKKVGKQVFIEGGSGENWDNLVSFALSNNFRGLENLSGIPGTVGASAVQNIGAYGLEVSEFIDSVFVFDTDNMSEFVLSKKDCNFSYRNSIFKKPLGRRWIITKILFSNNSKRDPDISYKDLADFFAGLNRASITALDVRNAVLTIRKNKLPDLSKMGTAGSFFKNPIIAYERGQKLLEKFPDIRLFGEKNSMVKVALASVLDKVCGLKGYRRGRVGLYKKQPLVLVNFGGASFGEIKAFAQEIASIVKEKTDIDIEREVEYVPEDLGIGASFSKG
jgi:UDP-N-acetylmuramate dehydrogenase